jgi:hypothetical protein
VWWRPKRAYLPESPVTNEKKFYNLVARFNPHDSVGDCGDLSPMTKHEQAMFDCFEKKLKIVR